jgi:SAM-dependent methyltransferase
MTYWDERLAGWWLDEVTGDAAYESEVLPLALDLLAPSPGGVYLDLGCGDGSLLAAVVAAGAGAVGVDASPTLAEHARRVAPVVLARLPDLSPLRSESVDGVSVVLVLEHLAEPAPLFAEAARVTRPGGTLVVVTNHPLVTAPGSGPFVDDDGEVLWRWGRYLEQGYSDEPAGDGTVRIHHHGLGQVLTAAAAAGWSLVRAVERGVGSERARTDPLLAAQAEVPRLLGMRWVLPAGATGAPIGAGR